VDVMSNAVFGVIFTMIAIMQRNWFTVCMSVCTLCGHQLSQLWKHTHAPHAMFVHLPAFLGFVAIARASM
jgi:hypothetical protein